MLEQPQCERILSIMNSHSIEDKLRAIEEAQLLFRNAFTPGMTDTQFAYSAMVVEQQYNYIREILQVKQIRIKADLGQGIERVAKAKAPKAEKAPAKKSKTYATFDMSKLAASFSQFQASEKEKLNESNSTPASDPDKKGTQS